MDKQEFPVSIAVADVDNMKAMNDNQGHAAGDDLLKHAAQVLQSAFRTSDVIARIGGDEFALILPKTDAHAAAQILARIRENLAKFNIERPHEPLRLSLGMATAMEGDLIEAFKLADAQMYEDKRAHRPKE